MSEQKQRNETRITTPSDVEILIEREFEAPRELVWECYTDPELIVEWLGPHRMKMRVEEFDMRTGGKYHYVHSDEEGNEYVFYGDVIEVVKPDFIIQTFTFVMDPPIPPSTERADFIELEGDRTRVVASSTFESKELRDGMIQSGMETGVREGDERLDDLLVRKQAAAA